MPNGTFAAFFLGVCVNLGQLGKAPDIAAEQQVTALVATVRIRNTTLGREGSGSLIGKSGPFVYILTAQHLVQGGDRFEVAVFAKGSYPKPHKSYASAEVVARTRGLADLALLRLRTTDDMPGFLRVCPESQVPEGTGLTMLTAGCDAGAAPTVRVEKGIGKKLAQRPDEKGTAAFWQLKAKYGLGRSGGPLIDKKGRLVGICSGTNRESTYFTHIDEIHRFLKQHGYRDLIAENPGK